MPWNLIVSAKNSLYFRVSSFNLKLVKMKLPLKITQQISTIRSAVIRTYRKLKKIWLPHYILPVLLVAAVISCTDDELISTGGNNYFFIDPNILHTDKYGIVLGCDTIDCYYKNRMQRTIPR